MSTTGAAAAPGFPPVRSKTLAIRSYDGRKLYEVTHYLYGIARFTSREDRNRFAVMAEEVRHLCQGPGVIRDRR